MNEPLTSPSRFRVELSFSCGGSVPWADEDTGSTSAATTTAAGGAEVSDAAELIGDCSNENDPNSGGGGGGGNGSGDGGGGSSGGGGGGGGGGENDDEEEEEEEEEDEAVGHRFLSELTDPARVQVEIPTLYLYDDWNTYRVPCTMKQGHLIHQSDTSCIFQVLRSRYIAVLWQSCIGTDSCLLRRIFWRAA